MTGRGAAICLAHLALAALICSGLFQAMADPDVSWVGAPGPSATPAQGSTQLLDDVVADIKKRVEQTRGLEACVDVPVRLVTRQQMNAALWAQLDEEGVADITGEERLLVRLGLLPPDTDLRALAEAITGTEAIGFYIPATGDLAIVDDERLASSALRWVLAHEYLHALQDQHFDIDATRAALPEGDAQTALTALAEGDAILLTIKALADDLPVPDSGLLEEGTMTSSAETWQALPTLVQRESLFPYLDGVAFAERLWADGGWRAIDAAWRDPPVSTEQIMHPEHYPDEQPLAIDLPDPSGWLGQGWSVSRQTTMGELRISVFVAGDDRGVIPLTADTGIRLPHAEAADGWAGDRVMSVEGPDDAWVVVWQTAWDSPEDAAEFATAAREVMASLTAIGVVATGTDITHATMADQGVLLLVADDLETLALSKASLGIDRAGA